jgi:hypothetical protein
MKKKLFVVIFAIAMIAVSATAVLSETWFDTTITLTATADSSATGRYVHVLIREDCAKISQGLTDSVASHAFGSVYQGVTYEWTVYVLNDGAQPAYLFYSPTHYTATFANQIDVNILVKAIAYGPECQITDMAVPLPTGVASLPFLLPEKAVGVAPNTGFLLAPGKEVKLDVMMTVNSVQLGTPITIPLVISAVNNQIQG